MGRVDFVVVIPGVKRLPQGNFDVMYCNSWIWGSYLQNSRQSKSIEHLPEHEGGVFAPQLFFQFPKDHSRSLKINMCLEHGVCTYTIIYHHIPSYTIDPSYNIIYTIYHHIPPFTPQMASFMGNIAVYSFRDPGQSHWGAIREARLVADFLNPSWWMIRMEMNGNIRKWNINAVLSCIIMCYHVLSNDNTIQW